VIGRVTDYAGIRACSRREDSVMNRNILPVIKREWSPRSAPGVFGEAATAVLTDNAVVEAIPALRCTDAVDIAGDGLKADARNLDFVLAKVGQILTVHESRVHSTDGNTIVFSE